MWGLRVDKLALIKTTRMVEEIAKRFALQEPIAQALRSVDREQFVPRELKHSAYRLDALPIKAQQYISSPLTVAKMTQYLSPHGADSVLEVGCGSGYQAAILSRLFRRVFTIERIDTLLSEARTRFRHLGLINIHTRSDDGQKGWEAYAPYDRILFSATAQRIPSKIFDQLTEGGILVAPMREGDHEYICRFTKRDGQLYPERLEECVFVPIVDGTER